MIGPDTGTGERDVARLRTREESELAAETLAALAPVRAEGAIPAVYREFAASEPALRAYLGMEAAVREGSLAPREIEAVKLLVSVRLGCAFCSTVHAAKGRRAGLDGDAQAAIRAGERLGEPRLDALLGLARTLLERPGPLSDDDIDAAREAGLDDANLVDLTLAMATIFFTNVTNHVNDTRA